jgi:hypothetical protein
VLVPLLFLLIALLFVAVAGLGAGLVWIARIAYREPERRLVIAIALIFAIVLLGLGWIAAALEHHPFSLFASSALVIFLFEGGCLIWLALTQPTWRRRRMAVAAGIILVGPGVFLFVQPYVGFEVANAQCGHNPVIATDSLIYTEKTYVLPGDAAYDTSSGSHYYCSAADAEAAGYRRP